MFKKKICSLIIFIFIFGIIKGNDNFYKDKIIFYIDNKLLDFKIEDDEITTSIEELNNFFIKRNVIKIEKWLPMARSNDRNGEVYLNRYYVVIFESPREDLDDILNELVLIENIINPEKIPIMKPAYIPNDEFWDELYGLAQVKAHLAYDLWDIDAGVFPGQMDEGEIVVAIPDIGLMWDHPDLVDNTWQNIGEDADGDGVVLELINNRWVFDPDDINDIDDDGDGYIDNFVGFDAALNDNDPYPFNSFHQHGTKVAGNVAAFTNNGIGLASVGFSVKLMGVNANADTMGNGWSLTHTDQAVLAAAQMGADIINCSWVSNTFLGAQNNVFQTVYNEYDCITLAAAGNGVYNGGPSDTTDFEPRYPAAYDNVISVTAMGPNNSFNCWANVHETVDIGAPGENILCTMPYDGTNSEMYAIGNGTSYATPLTAGAVALVKSVIPNASKETIISKIIQTADYYPDMEGSCSGNDLEGLLGSGQLNVHRAILASIGPELLLSDVNFDTPDGFVHPGDTVMINFVIGNTPYFMTAENVIVTLSSNDSNLTVISDSIIYENIFLAGDQSEGQFIITVSENTLLGNIDCSISISATSGESDYINIIPFQVPIYMGQFGYPIDDISIQESPIIADLDGNALNEIYFSSDSQMYGTWIAGFDVSGYPFLANNSISSSSAVGDLNGNGDKELVFGTSSGVLHALTKTGGEFLNYEQADSIIGSPVLADLDLDGQLEIIFVAGNTNDCSLYVIYNTGNDYPGFPVAIPERILVGPSVADLENDMIFDIVLVSAERNVYVIDGNGSIKDGFPYLTSNSIESPATLVDLDSNQDIEIIVGNINGDVYVLNHDASLMTSYSINDTIIGGISVSDIDDNGTLELIFTGYDELVHAWDPISSFEILGWPISMGDKSISEPLIADLDNDNDLEVIITTLNGMVNIYHHDGSEYDNFPYNAADSIISTSSIGDLDNDGDYELIFGTTNNLEVIDILDPMGNRYSWKMYRANERRDGFFNSSLASLDYEKNKLPNDFSISNNYPNPFNPLTTFSYNLPKNAKVKIVIYDINGRVVKTLIEDNQLAGYQTISWNSTNQIGETVATGLYFYSIETDNFSKTKKMLLLK